MGLRKMKKNNVYYVTSASKVYISCMPLIVVAENIKQARENFNKKVKPENWPDVRPKFRKVDTIHKNRMKYGVYLPSNYL
ncbi:hypothetical protein LCGC14_1070260 [marine sediment metagenome]|uniref:Uncharacterized protein n=1 Tax=marine sediment metagenome TaxID=412755 RepID=A0A0F9N5M2_9ZZZZ